MMTEKEISLAKFWMTPEQDDFNVAKKQFML